MYGASVCAHFRVHALFCCCESIDLNVFIFVLIKYVAGLITL